MQVTAQNPLWSNREVYFFAINEFNEYEGEEIAVKWVLPSQMALTTGNPDFPFRVLERSTIVSIDGTKNIVTPVASSATKIVKGSKGEDYIVTLGSKRTCTCSGFQFRKTCKHVNS
jgi:hypothetical protein